MDLHKNKGQVTVVIDLSFSASLDEVKEFILNEQSPFHLKSERRKPSKIRMVYR